MAYSRKIASKTIVSMTLFIPFSRESDVFVRGASGNIRNARSRQAFGKNPPARQSAHMKNERGGDPTCLKPNIRHFAVRA